MLVGVCRPGAGPRRWLDENYSSGGEDGGDNVTAARLLAAEELTPGMRIVKALTKQDLHTGQARAPYLESYPTVKSQAGLFRKTRDKNVADVCLSMSLLHPQQSNVPCGVGAIGILKGLTCCNHPALSP